MNKLLLSVAIAAVIITLGTDVLAQSKKNMTYAIGFEQLAHPENLPVFYPAGTKKNRIISYDACGGNGFGFFSTIFTKYIDENGEAVFFDAYGPGCLYREQINIWGGNGVGRDDKNLRIKFYFDGEETPRIDENAFDFFHGDCEPFVEPFMYRNTDWFAIGYYPFTFAKRLKITLSGDRINEVFEKKEDPSGNWQQFDYLTYPVGTPVVSWTRDEDIHNKQLALEQWNNLGKDPKKIENKFVSINISLKAGEEKVIFSKKGKGAVSSLTFKLKPFTEETFFNTYIRIRWEGNEAAAVDMPVSYFFGAGGPKDGVWKNTLKSLMFGFNAEEHTMYSYWPMPFWNHAEISLVNKSSEDISNLSAQIGWTASMKYDKKNSGHFMAKLTSDISHTGGLVRKEFEKPFAVAFQEEGYGQVVSVNMFSGNFYEDGDEFTFIDGSHTSFIHGDGTEDDFNQGWAGRKNQKALWGALDNGVKGSYRLHLYEPYIFYDGINMTFEYTNSIYGQVGNTPRKRKGTEPEHIETEFVVCYYKSPKAVGMKLTDSLDVADATSEKSHALVLTGEKAATTITQPYDSYEDADNYCVVTDAGKSFDGAEFKVKIDPANNGVRIRARINREGNGRQLSNVYVDGEKLETPWYVMTYSAQDRRGKKSFDGWFDTEYEIPATCTKGKKEITVRLEHVESVAGELNAFMYWIYSYVK